MLWAVMCGGALGLTACGESDGPPEDASTDTADAVDAADTADAADVPEEDPGATYYGPAPDY